MEKKLCGVCSAPEGRICDCLRGKCQAAKGEGFVVVHAPVGSGNTGTNTKKGASSGHRTSAGAGRRFQ